MIDLQEQITQLERLMAEVDEISSAVYSAYSFYGDAQSKADRLSQAECEAEQAVELAEADLRVTQEVLRNAKDPSAVITASNADMRETQFKKYLADIQTGQITNGIVYRSARAAHQETEKEVMGAEQKEREAKAKRDAVAIQAQLHIARLGAAAQLVQVLAGLKSPAPGKPMDQDRQLN